MVNIDNLKSIIPAMNDMKDASKLLEKYSNGKASEKEKELLERWVHELGGNEPVSYTHEEYDEIKERGREIILPFVLKEKRVKLWPKIAIAASIAIAVMAGVYYYQLRSEQSGQQIVASDINPGKVAATLTLSNGKKIYIADVKSGNVAIESGVKITKNESGELVYTIIDNQGESAKMQTLTTYRGETQALILPDGSKVWLNAASSIKYPSSFAAASKRRVELAGEAYFEIAKDKSHPFLVATDKQEVEVLGTHFNINSYSDEPATKTTLLEGSVRVSNTTTKEEKILQPGMQANLMADKISIKEVDVYNNSSWRNNQFSFDSEDIQSIMRAVARWYDVEVIYEGGITKDTFSGGVSRFDKLSSVLQSLEQAGKVHFRISERKVYVTP